MLTTKHGEPLISLTRQLEIREFYISLRELEHKHGLKLEASDDHTFEIIDTQRAMPQGYHFSAIVRSDGKLEIGEWVEEQ
jgi:uncharacterized Fe-S cluster-containing radical SAM superfamily enzyme